MRHVSRTAGTLALLAVLALAAAMLVPAALGLKRYVITTGSMTGAIDAGSIVYDRPTPVADLRVGDVITYTPPPGNDVEGLVTHRIHSIERGPGGRPAIVTKGDANDAPDTWTFAPTRPTLNRVEFDLPYLGHAYAKLTTKEGRMLAFAIPGLIIAASVLLGLWRDAGRDVQRRRAQEQHIEQVVR